MRRVDLGCYESFLTLRYFGAFGVWKSPMHLDPLGPFSSSFLAAACRKPTAVAFKLDMLGKDKALNIEKR